MDKKRILMVHNFYQIGGGEHTVYKNEIEMLRENGHEVLEYTRSNDELKKSKFKLLLLPFTAIWSFKTYRDVKRIIEKENIDVVHCHNTFPLISPSVYYASRKKEVPVIQTIHNFRFLCPNGSFYCDGEVCEKCNQEWNFKNALKNNCYRGSKIQTLVLITMLKFHRVIGTYKKISYIFLTEFNKHKFSKLININSDQVFVKPNFFKKSISDNDNCYDYTPDKEYNYFSYVGRLEKNKGILSLIAMWEQLPDNYVLHIFGDGTYRDEVLSAEKNNTNIKYFGFQQQKEVLSDTRNSCAVIISSEWHETFGMSIPESFSMGVPVITSNFGAPESIITDSKGGLVYVKDDLASFKKCLDLISENRNFYSNNALNYYNDNFTDKTNYRRLMGIYDKARIIK